MSVGRQVADRNLQICVPVVLNQKFCDIPPNSQQLSPAVQLVGMQVYLVKVLGGDLTCLIPIRAGCGHVPLYLQLL